MIDYWTNNLPFIQSHLPSIVQIHCLFPAHPTGRCECHIVHAGGVLASLQQYLWPVHTYPILSYVFTAVNRSRDPPKGGARLEFSCLIVFAYSAGQLLELLPHSSVQRSTPVHTHTHIHTFTALTAVLLVRVPTAVYAFKLHIVQDQCMLQAFLPLWKCTNSDVYRHSTSMRRHTIWTRTHNTHVHIVHDWLCWLSCSLPLR